MKTVSELFEDVPVQWGLRGDPFLWKEMKEYLGARPLPESPDDLERILRSAFKELTQGTLDKPTPIRLERYDHGGMSSGMVCPEFWRETAIPLIVSRFCHPGGGS
jgi:hypothetical protein